MDRSYYGMRLTSSRAVALPQAAQETKDRERMEQETRLKSKLAEGASSLIGSIAAIGRLL